MGKGAWEWGRCAAVALVLAGCGGGAEGPVHPAPVDPARVRVPGDAPAALERCRELLDSLADPLQLGTELHRRRPVADELAVVCDTLGEVAAKSYAPELASKLGARGREMATEARKLAKHLRDDDAVSARQVHTGLVRMRSRLQESLDHATRKKEE